MVALSSALYAQFPRGIPSEVLYTPFWDRVGTGLPEFASRILHFDVSIRRYSCGCILCGQARCSSTYAGPVCSISYCAAAGIWMTLPSLSQTESQTIW